MNTINDFLNYTIKKYPSKTCIITKEKKLSFNELNDLISNFSSHILKFPKQSVVSIVFENTVDCVIAYLGTLRAGGVSHLISPSISNENLIHQIKSSKPLIDDACQMKGLQSAETPPRSTIAKAQASFPLILRRGLCEIRHW